MRMKCTWQRNRSMLVCAPWESRPDVHGTPRAARMCHLDRSPHGEWEHRGATFVLSVTRGGIAGSGRLFRGGRARQRRWLNVNHIDRFAYRNSYETDRLSPTRWSLPDWPAPVDHELDRAVQRRSHLRAPSVDRDGRQAGRQLRSRKGHRRWLETEANAVRHCFRLAGANRIAPPARRPPGGAICIWAGLGAAALFDNRSVTKDQNAPLPAGGGAKPEALGERDSLSQWWGGPRRSVGGVSEVSR